MGLTDKIAARFPNGAIFLDTEISFDGLGVAQLPSGKKSEN